MLQAPTSTLSSLADMEEQRSPLNWADFYYQEADQAVDELKHSLLYSTWELEAAVLSAHEEISRKEDEITQLKDFLAKVVEERDEFKAKCHALALENKQLADDIRILPPRKSPTPSDVAVDDENVDRFSSLQSSHSDETNNSLQQSHESAADSDAINLCSHKKPLPENGKFLQAVMEAGPLLQTLLLAGPLPRWQHPPPQLSSSEIPPVVGIPSFTSTPAPNSAGFKRGHAVVNSAEVSGIVSPNKYQKIVHHHHHHQSSSLTQLN